jgi:hypothetical protein
MNDHGVLPKGTALAPAADDHHQDIDLVVPVRLDAIALVEPDQVGLQVLPSSRHSGPGWFPRAARPARSTGGTASSSREPEGQRNLPDALSG